MEEIKNVKAKIVIDYFDDGSVNVHGPMNDKIMCLGMLEIAKALTLNYQPPQNNGSGIIIPKMRIDPGGFKHG